MNSFISQQHLTKNEMINQGSYYTSKKITDIVFRLVKTHVKNYKDYILLDTSCGYGSFLTDDDFNRKIGADIDENSLKRCPSNCSLVHCNSLSNISRDLYNIAEDDKILIVGNPPYNDTTSQSHQTVKNV